MNSRNLNILITLITLLTNFSCFHSNKIIEGDLYFGFFRVASYYNQPDSIIKGFEYYMDTVHRAKIDSSDRRFISMYDKLRQENLLFSAFIELILNDSSKIYLYLDSTDYHKIKIYKRKNLIKSGQKIRIKVEGKDLGNGMFLCQKLISIEKINGQTYQIRSKFKIEDYQ